MYPDTRPRPFNLIVVEAAMSPSSLGLMANLVVGTDVDEVAVVGERRATKESGSILLFYDLFAIRAYDVLSVCIHIT